MTIDRIEICIRAIGEGRMVALVDDAHRENEADIVIAAEHITEQQMAFLIRYTSGIICVPITQEKYRALGVPLLTSSQPARFGTPFTMPLDYISDTTSGVSAHDRVATVRALARDNISLSDFGMPGHVFPLVEAVGGLRARQGHTEGSLHLMRLAGVRPIAVIGELMNDDGTMMRGNVLINFLQRHTIPLCSIEDLFSTLPE